MAGVGFRPIDPFTPGTADGYRDDAVTVRRGRPAEVPAATARTELFAVAREGRRLLLVHAVPDSMIDNDLSALIVRDLFEPGWVSGADTFERLLTGVVLTSRPDPLDAWELFYRNTLRQLAELDGGGPGSGSHGCLADIAPVYRRAASLVAGTGARSVVDLGSCFGFFPLGLLRDGVRCVYASDISAGTCRLVELIGARLQPRPGDRLHVLSCDAGSVPLESGSVDVVTSLHLLEHVEQPQGDRILAEAVRLARRRVVVAVPTEVVPDPAYGHVRALTPEALAGCARRVAPDWTARVEEYHGAWLVLDRPNSLLG